MLELRLRAVNVTKRPRGLAVAVLATVVLCPGARASITIDRRDFGMTYAGFAVGREVTITIDAVGVGDGSSGQTIAE